MTAPRGGRRGRVPWVEIEVDAGLRVTAWSARAEECFGASQAAALGRPVAELVPVAGGDAAWRRVLDEDASAQVWPLAREGDERVFEWQHACLYDEDGAVCGALCHGREVTARAAEERLARRDRAILQAIHRTLSVVLWAIDDRGTFVVQCGRAMQMPEGAQIGRSIFREYADSSVEAAVRAALAGQPTHGVSSSFGKDWETWVIPMSAAQTDVAVLGITLDVSDAAARERALREQLELTERQRRAIRSMSTPIIEVWDRVLCLPILGTVDGARTAEMMEDLLQAVTRVRARFAILDLTGVEGVDTASAAHLLGLVRAIELLGARGIITGIHPDIAATMVTLGVDLSRIVVRANLREALEFCLANLAGRRA